MNNFRDIRSDAYEEPGRETAVVLHHASYISLLRINRFLSFAVLFLLVVMVFFAFTNAPSNYLIENFAKHRGTINIAEIAKNPVFSDEIEVLKAQMVGLISGSIESKLRSLEINLNSGKVSEADLAVFKGLKEDMKVLRTYSDYQHKKLMVSAENNPANLARNDLLMQEIAHLKMLIYLTIASCGLMLTAIAGVWMQKRVMLQDQTEVRKRIV